MGTYRSILSAFGIIAPPQTSISVDEPQGGYHVAFLTRLIRTLGMVTAGKSMPSISYAKL